MSKYLRSCCCCIQGGGNNECNVWPRSAFVPPSRNIDSCHQPSTWVLFVGLPNGSDFVGVADNNIGTCRILSNWKEIFLQPDRQLVRIRHDHRTKGIVLGITNTQSGQVLALGALIPLFWYPRYSKECCLLLPHERDRTERSDLGCQG